MPGIESGLAGNPRLLSIAGFRAGLRLPVTLSSIYTIKKWPNFRPLQKFPKNHVQNDF
jgi:hypothetical protein